MKQRDRTRTDVEAELADVRECLMKLVGSLAIEGEIEDPVGHYYVVRVHSSNVKRAMKIMHNYYGIDDDERKPPD